MLHLFLSLVITLLFTNTIAFQVSSSRFTNNARGLYMDKDMFSESLSDVKLEAGQLTRQRYIATNRFNCREGKMAQFEKRWADRTSRLSLLDGFRFFTLLRRVERFGQKYNSNEGNYVSYTIWETKDNFDAWRTGDAFKEAHGGGSIMDFAKLISTALFILNGGPKPAFYDGLLLEASKLPSMSSDSLGFKGDNGWRSIPADGQNFINADVFVSSKKYVANKPADFEQAFSKKQRNGENFEGLIGCLLQRRDAEKADDGFTHVATYFFKNQACYEDYINSNVGTTNDEEKFVSKVESVFYEGKLALMKEL